MFSVSNFFGLKLCKQETKSDNELETNLPYFEQDELEESVNNDDRDFNKTASQPDLMQDQVWVNPDAWDLAQLIKVYEQF